MSESVDCVVAGAGVVGLAVARALAMQGREVLVLEPEADIGTGTSSRSSEVIHAGIYYPTGSFKARWCVRGRELLISFCESHGVAHQRTGKLIVATSSAQLGTLEAARAQAEANGVHDLRWLSGAQAKELEPALVCEAALHSPGTGIVDSHALMLALLGDIERHGGFLVRKTALAHMWQENGAMFIEASDGTRLLAKLLVNAAGLAAPQLAKKFRGLDARLIPEARYAKGSYFALSGRAPFSRLIYPVPEPGGLGVHLTLDLAMQARFGPDVQWVDDPQDLTVDPRRGDAFYAQVRKYWPGLPEGSLVPAYAGMRPKIGFGGALSSDFVVQGPQVHGLKGLVNLFGIESPGLTSALAIGEHVAALGQVA
ncbi:MAG: NAD(P)/FAD-dependent oxidoreductase [Simplicispira suum]|uniref:NAD(P)/FAD-dependent oxidoreductase n=1 Tax=Simplicispira suum TaxID=2109915 RepID=UPI001C6B8AEC|nr:NAD(P)/FAD-dependent oxidoreductase [Simplicispira suum]MBW7834223.1 NAD(P)/FAD-dependent oxidoreductase [Simplicispira suum]